MFKLKLSVQSINEGADAKAKAGREMDGILDYKWRIDFVNFESITDYNEKAEKWVMIRVNQSDGSKEWRIEVTPEKIPPQTVPKA